MEIVQRMKAPTPSFFQKIKKIGLILTGISAAIITAPVSLPAILVSIAGYAAVAGATATAISQLTTSNDVPDSSTSSNSQSTSTPVTSATLEETAIVDSTKKNPIN